MSDSPTAPYEGILNLCARAHPQPWYPADFAKEKGWEGDRLDEPLNQLRLSGLVELTDWIPGKGQGYRLTEDGEAVLRSPRLMARLRAGYLPAVGELPNTSVRPLHEGTTYGRGEAVRASLAYGMPPRVTQILIGLNVLVFAFGLFIAAQNGRARTYLVAGDLKITHILGSLSAEDLLKGQWWRLLASCFVHYGGLHIGMNMYALWVVGRLAEQIWGRWRYLTIYLVSGLCGSCAAVLANPDSPSAGASGAIWGVLACLPAWLLLNRRHLPQRLVSDWLRQLVTVLIINALISFLPGISWAAHFGGGAAGFATAVLLNLHRFDRSVFRWVFLVLIPLIPIASVAAVVRAKDRSPAWAKLAQGVKEEKAHAADRAEEKEIDRVNQELVPAISQARAEAEAAYGEFKEFRRTNPRARDRNPKEVQQVLTRLESSRERLSEALQKLANAGAFDSEYVNSVVNLARHYCEHADKRAQLAEDSLRAGDNWGIEQDERISVQNNYTDDALKKYDAKRLHVED